MNKQLINQHLHLFGLDETEIKIYLNLFQSGPKTPLELSRQSGVNRSKIYRYLERLKNKKLIESLETGWSLKINAAKAENLELEIKEKEQQIQEQKEILPAILTELKSLVPPARTDFEIKSYRDREGLKQMLWNQLSAQKEILQFAYQTRNEIVGTRFAEKIREEQVARKIKLYEVENATDQGTFGYTQVKGFPKFYASRHIAAKILTIKQNLAVFNDIVSIMNWQDENCSGVEIINASFAQMQREIFWQFWKIAGRRRVTKAD